MNILPTIITATNQVEGTLNIFTRGDEGVTFNSVKTDNNIIVTQQDLPAVKNFNVLNLDVELLIEPVQLVITTPTLSLIKAVLPANFPVAKVQIEPNYYSALSIILTRPVSSQNLKFRLNSTLSNNISVFLDFEANPTINAQGNQVWRVYQRKSSIEPSGNITCDIKGIYFIVVDRSVTPNIEVFAKYERFVPPSVHNSGLYFS